MEKIITISAETAKKINFSMQHNYIPIIRNITIKNNCDENISRVCVRISFKPEFAKPYESFLMDIGAMEIVELSPVNIVLLPEYLSELEEKTVGYILVEVVCGDKIIASVTNSIELLSYDEWTGSLFMPELICAFFSPNRPIIHEIVSKASQFMLKWNNSPLFSGYKCHSTDMVKMQMRAIYAAIQDENIACTLSCTSYNETLKVRSPDMVIKEKSGTCIELAMIYCACMENINLNPLLIITNDHAFAGCWLEDLCFPDCLQYDYFALKKHASNEINEISLIECTDFAAGKNIDFNTSENQGLINLSRRENFEYAVDVRRTRKSGIRSMPSKLTENETIKIVSNAEDTTIPKQETWERKLLNLSLCNNLLNFGYDSLNVRIIVSDISKLKDELLSGKEFSLCPATSNTILTEENGNLLEIENDREHISVFADEDIKAHIIRTLLTENELQRNLSMLIEKAEVCSEENGENTICLALGFLEWYETESSKISHYAPIVLLPINIRRNVNDGTFTIKFSGDKAQINITLLEMMKQNFGIDIQSEKLQENDDEIDLPMILNLIKQSIMPNPRWNIIKQAFIGQFSLSRFIMWNDIHNRSDEISKNKVAANLISGRSGLTGGNISITPEELDRYVMLSDMAIPIPADSSQLSAVYASALGKSFVLNGPPGTGKSQTVTNIIANSLYHEKTVLFIAKKRATLEIVRKKLDKLGLSPFCLNLFSNNSNIKNVFGQLEETLKITEKKSPKEYTLEAEKLLSLRNNLNDTTREIHKIRSYGISLYDAAVKAEKCSKYGGKLKFQDELLKNITADKIDVWHNEIENLISAGRKFGNVTNTPLRCCQMTECTSKKIERLSDLLNDFKTTLRSLDNVIKLLSILSGKKRITYSQYLTENELLKIASGEGDIIIGIFCGDLWEKLKEQVDVLIEKGIQQQSLKAEIMKDFEISVLGFDSYIALSEWETAQDNRSIAKYVKRRKLINELNSHAKELKTVNKNNFTHYCEKISSLKELTNDIENIPDEIINLFSSNDGLLVGEKTDWNSLRLAVNISVALRNILKNTQFTSKEKSFLAEQITNYYGTSSRKAEIFTITDEMLTNTKKFENIINELENEFEIKLDSLDSETWQTDAIAQTKMILSSLPKLKEWTEVMNLCRRIEEYGIGNVAKAYIDGDIAPDDLVKSFECDLYRRLVSITIFENPVLAKFKGKLFEDNIKKYDMELKKFRNLTIQELLARLSSQIHLTDNFKEEIDILKSAIDGSEHEMSIRRLFEMIPNVLRILCPVMLMSPISAAQYINQSYPKFDYVIFDDASQIQTCEAVGALTRGKNVIIAGDTKQLPPENFSTFCSIDDDDSKSFLDDCLSLQMPKENLLWHYRSKHESLISYSNSKYYDNNLYTFPSADNKISRVRKIHVEGFYDRSDTCTNKAEAQAIVNEIVRRLKDDKLRKQSIGVITLNVQQQNLIDNLLDEEYSKDMKLEKKALEQYEPIVVKNLDNVQSIERDVIMLSIVYGPDKNGKLLMDFGPLNRNDGWCRFNVAITGARQQMLVFSIINSDMIDLSKTRSKGVEGLKGYLKFAEQRENPAIKAGRKKVTAKGFELIVAEELKKRGYCVDCCVGSSDFKIDIAVVDPNDKNRYILGISCGTRENFSSSTAEDRYISQQSVLHELGWDTMNVHILDWIDDSEKVMEKIENRMKGIKN